jgi:hypothetical protein
MASRNDWAGGLAALLVCDLAAIMVLVTLPIREQLPRRVVARLPFKLVSARATTASTMSVLKRRILRYARNHQRLPARISDLPELPGFTNSSRDAWYRPIRYDVSPEGVVTLSSPAAWYSFPARSSDGQWSDELVDWLEFGGPKARRRSP